ncbi:MAG TPA: hypothetical protein VIG46_10050 [Candidatus Baltobacteraceae bacterium]|jgi:hypothetical protein
MSYLWLLLLCAWLIFAGLIGVLFLGIFGSAIHVRAFFAVGLGTCVALALVGLVMGLRFPWNPGTSFARVAFAVLILLSFAIAREILSRP